MKVSIFEIERVRKGSKKGLHLTVKEDEKSSTTLAELQEMKDENGNKKYVEVKLIKNEAQD